jgi:UDPglucose--hexose-1-phosphate uridylyltransferase
MLRGQTLRLTENPHRRLNALTNEWVLVSPHRATRPWQGEVAQVLTSSEPAYDPNCYLCPGNARAGGIRNPPYTTTFVFANDFAALKPETSPARLDIDRAGLLVAEAEPGICRVICFSPRHDLTLATMGLPEIELVVRTWVGQFRELGGLENINHVQIFENRGSMMGASNPHPHCQIWANGEVPNLPVRELAAQREYQQAHGACLLCAYLKMELDSGERIVCKNESFVALVPYWAVWPFETMILSRRHAPSFLEFGDTERNDLAAILRSLTIRYDNLFTTSFPYSMGFHQQPTDGQPHPEWHFHAHYFPPLLRSATVQKFMVGYELLASPQRDITAESAAAALRELTEVHYLDRV